VTAQSGNEGQQRLTPSFCQLIDKRSVVPEDTIARNRWEFSILKTEHFPLTIPYGGMV
jgi:hypothetical protein